MKTIQVTMTDEQVETLMSELEAAPALLKQFNDSSGEDDDASEELDAIGYYIANIIFEAYREGNLVVKED